jgi:lipopolysaccharide/colanic/teichoic acid biosynthesis glycosyltransferase
MSDVLLEEGFSKVIKLSRQIDPALEGIDYLTSPQKREFDQRSAKILRIATALLVRCACKLVVAEDGGPPIVELPRVGMNGEIFMQLKIRTMKPGSENQPEPVRDKDENDPRITKSGRFLRMSSIDELPQLINVLRGEMSMVASRPVSTLEDIAYYEINPLHDNAYKCAPPGLTGISQISGRAKRTIPERIADEIEYMDKASSVLDREIYRATFLVVLSRRGAC